MKKEVENEMEDELRSEKVMQFLILELSREEETESSLYKFQSHVNDTMDSPYDSYEAAHKMNKMLEEYKHKNV